MRRALRVSDDDALVTHVSGVGLAAAIGLGVFIFTGVVTIAVVSLVLITALALHPTLRRHLFRVTRWVGAAAIAPALASLHPLMVPVVAGLVTLAFVSPTTVGAIDFARLPDIKGRKVLAGTALEARSVDGKGLRGRLRSAAGELPEAWELRDTEDLLLLRAVHAGACTLDSDHGALALDGPVWIEVSGRGRWIDATEAYVGLGVPRYVELPSRLRLVERSVRADEEVAVFGHLLTEGRAAGYRDVSFARRLVGEANGPLVVR